jgi:acetyl esterase/lipase
MNTRLLTLFLLAGTTLAQTATPSASSTIDVWPEGKMPGKGAKEPESEVKRDDGFQRITNVSRPTLALFPAARKDGAAAAMIVCPGGGYNYTVMDKEGSEIAAWLNSNGISALVLKYRTPQNREGALQDLQRSLSLVRARAAEWNIDPKRLGVIGFSAGGNVAAKASTRFDERTYPAIDEIDQQSCRPDFAVLVYPAYLDDKAGHVSPDLTGSASFQVASRSGASRSLPAKIPPTLIVHTEDDKTHVVGSKVYDAALTESKVPHEFKLYPTGGHGYGVRCEGDAKVWPEDTLTWLGKIGVR